MKIHNIEKGFISVAAALVLSSSIYASVNYTVSTLENGNDGVCMDSNTSLEEAIICSSDGGIIDFSVTGTITPPSAGYNIDKNITITGPVDNNISFNTIYDSSIFTISVGNSAVISDMTINNVMYSAAINNLGNLTINDSNISNNENSCGGNAAGIENSGSLTISNSTISNNITNSGSTAAIYNTGNLSIIDSNISDNTNSSFSSGGSAGITNSGSLTISNSNFNNNQTTGGSTNPPNTPYSGGSGGAIYNSGVLDIEKSSFFDNNASIAGGAIFANSGSNTKIFNTTISSNDSLDGGGIYNYGADINISNSTIVYNTSGTGGTPASGGGIYSSSGNVNIKNTIIANNTDLQNNGPDIFGAITSYGYNLIGTDQNATIAFTTGDINGTDPMLNAITLGNSTYFHTLQSISPAIEAGSCTDINGVAVSSDQNSTSRPQYNTCDIGSMEYDGLFTKFALKTHGGILDFDGTAYVQGESDVDLTTGYLTLEAWVNIDDTNDYRTIVSQYDSTDESFKLRIDASDKVEFWTVNNNSGNALTSMTALTPNKWHHVTTTFDGTNRKIYIDGVLDKTDSPGYSSIDDTTAKLEIGSYYNGSSNMKGMIDEVRVWNVAKTETEIVHNMGIQLDANETGLQSYYNFDERVNDTVYDISNSGSKGKFSSIDGIKRLNFLGDALGFESAGDISVPNHASLDLNTTFSISAWFKTKVDSSGGIQQIVNKYNISGNQRSYALGLANGGTQKIQLSLSSDGTNVTTINSISDIDINKWYHVSVTSDGSNIMIYLNGELDNTVAYSSGLYQNSETLKIGADITNSENFDGVISEVSIFTKTLNEAGVQQIMSASLFGTESDLVAYWPLNEGSGNIAYDKTGTNNGTMATGVSWTDTAPTIYGSNIYTTVNIPVFNKFIVENNTTMPTFSYNGGVPATVVDFNGTTGTFLYYNSTDTNETLDINSTIDGSTFIISPNTFMYESYLNLTLNLSNVTLAENNITNIQVIGISPNDENFTIPDILSGNIVDDDNTYTVPIYNVDQNFSIRIDTNTSGVSKVYWMNFYDNKLYQDNNGSTEFYSIIGSALNSFSLDFVNTNIVTNNAPAIEHIYDRFPTPNFSDIVILYDVNDTENDSSNIVVNTFPTGIVTAVANISSITGNAQATLTIEKIMNAVGFTTVSITATDAYGSTTRSFNIVVAPQEYNMISEKATTSSTDVFSGNLYSFESQLDFYDSSTEVDISKLEIGNNTLENFSEFEDVNGTVTKSTEAHDIPNTMKYESGTDLVFGPLTTAYTDFGTPFNFCSCSGAVGKYIYLTYSENEKDKHGLVIASNGSNYTSFDDFLSEQVVDGNTTFGLMRNHAKDKFLLLDSFTVGTSTNGNLTEYDENETIVTASAGTWTLNRTTNLMTFDGLPVGYYDEAAFMLEVDDYDGVSKIHWGEYIASGETYKYLLLNKDAKDYIYNTISPNPKIAIPLTTGYNYVSLENNASICTQTYKDAYTSICDQTMSIEDIFSSNANIKTMFKFEEAWQYREDNSSINPAYGLDRFSIISPLDGLVVKTDADTTLLLPYNDDANQTNDYVGMFVDSWYLLSNNKEQDISQIATDVTTANSGHEILYIMLKRNDAWMLYADPEIDGTIDPSITRLTTVKKAEVFWIMLKSI